MNEAWCSARRYGARSDGREISLQGLFGLHGISAMSHHASVEGRALST
jgi:hypothetical protein